MPLLCLFEDDRVSHLRPLVDLRAAYDLRLGMRTLGQTAVDAFAPKGVVLHARPTVAPLAALGREDAIAGALPGGTDVLFVNGRYVAAEGPVRDRLTRAVKTEEDARLFVQDDVLVAAWVPDAANRLPDGVLETEALTAEAFDGLPVEDVSEARLIGRLWHLIDELRPALARDFAHRHGPYNILDSVYDRAETDVHPSVTAVNPEQIVIAPGATVRPGAILNAEDGPIVIDRNATVFERAVLRGPLYVGPKAQVKVGADVEGSAFGYYSKVGGEVHDSVIHSLSNKGHPGFLGHSYLGRWCNLGADTNTSNLKNDYGTVSLYDPVEADFVDTGRQFVGLIMGDHAKCGINTMFNTGTVVGTASNLFGAGFPPRFVPAYSWGGADRGFVEYRLAKALEVADRVMARRDRPFTDAHRAAMTHLFEQTAATRERGMGN